MCLKSAGKYWLSTYRLLEDTIRIIVTQVYMFSKQPKITMMCLRGGWIKEVVKLVEKQKIILKHLDGISNRSIADDLHISKDTVNKYVAEYECKKQTF